MPPRLNHFRFFVAFYLTTTNLKISSGLGAKISHNAPAVYDVFAARIEKCVAFLGLANCGCSEPWE
jgi:hypothetical protein